MTARIDVEVSELVASFRCPDQKTHAVLATLTPREELAVRMRFGVSDYKPHTLREVAKELDVSVGRTRLILAKAIRKLRHPSRAKHLLREKPQSFSG